MPIDGPTGLFEVAEPDFEYIVKCVLKLTISELEVYLTLIENPGIGVDELSEIMRKDRSGIYRSLQTLLEKGLVKREYRILKHGGYKYIYTPLEIDTLKAILKEELERWFKRLNEVVDKFTLDEFKGETKEAET
ncbi:putative transcriptional regulator [Archaeoglobus sulfaticallidus PM70-1]|uniref:Putative transcriptional regulator n=1 Tax=Archaeoglobus sulfaticallidus PM70-1 TaxID=387631 RepID=N0BB80_9EURY|nr:helix-turn-helix domain-containing protein [Archaeoglobus sulfaticallidus]AGK60864.1 putative transcriptional regulator [Archaeoglobus sulfaticallidus PM70-1]